MSVKESKEHIHSTMGMLRYVEEYGECKKVMIAFFRWGDKVILRAVNFENLEKYKKIPDVEISLDEYNDRDYSVYDDYVEFNWACNKIGLLEIEDDI